MSKSLKTFKLFEESESKIPPLGIRILPHLKKSKLDQNLIDSAPSMDIAPWKLSVSAVCLDFAKFWKETANPETFKQFYLQFNFRISFIEKIIIMNGSKTEAGVAAAAD